MTEVVSKAGLHILVNLLPIDRGGGLQNALNFWRAAREFGEADQWTALVRTGSTLADLPRGPHQRLVEFPFTGSAARLVLGSRRVAALSRNADVDVCLTLAGPGPFGLPVPFANGWHEPHPAYPESTWWKTTSVPERLRAQVKYWYSRRVIRQARIVIVQTSVMADRLAAAWGLDRERMRVIPNAPSLFLEGAMDLPPKERMGSPPVLLTLTEAYPHKNVAVLVPTATALARQGHRICFRISLAAQEPAGADLLAQADRAGVRGWFDLIGRVPHDRIGAVYAAADGVLLPSLLESFSANYVEAMALNRPILTSDRDFARVVCAGAALYFDPEAPDDVARVIEAWLRDSQLRRDLCARGRQRLRVFPDWRERFDLYRAAVYDAARFPPTRLPRGRFDP